MLQLPSENKTGSVLDYTPFDASHYREIKRKNIVRLLLTYLAPLLLLTVFFYIQYGNIESEGRRLHLRALAENQANILDLFLSERLVNLANMIDDPKFVFPPAPGKMPEYLGHLQKNSQTFVDIGYFDSSGIQVAYAGPYPSLEKRNYSSEPWYLRLKERQDNFIITDIYLGFRQRPHFTIAVNRIIDNRYVVLRATLDPAKMYEYLTSNEDAGGVFTSIVNKDGYYQLVTEHIGTPLETSSFVPPKSPRLGAEHVEIGGASFNYAYSWLLNADWALIVQWSSDENLGFLSGNRLKILALSAVVILLIFLIIINRAQKLVTLQMESDRTRAQLEHASKLASVGELAAGIAHEINNPLAVISEEAGLMKDLMDPAFGQVTDPEDLTEHLDNIQESVFRCRDITRKLLGFVRRTDVDLKPNDIHDLIDGVMDGLLSKEMAVENIEVVREYDRTIPPLVTDGNQLQQVFLNIFNNAADAIGGVAGTITIATSAENKFVRVAISDTGEGMDKEKINKIFMPFFSTKEVGKGTGLGLSVSYGIIKSLGGKIEVVSEVGKGSTFIIVLPFEHTPGKP